jgi:N-dimethylarginine dimethylaminohydrolase
MNLNGQSEIKPLKSILLKHPKEAFISQENIDSQWQKLNYTSAPDFNKTIDEYEAFLELLRRQVEDFYFLPRHDRTGLDSIYVHDPVVITQKGTILCRMGKKERQGEALACEEYLKQIGVPVLGAITGEGRLEGGDVVWLDDRTLAVGQGYRTNLEGIAQLKKLTADFVDELIIVPLPHWDGPNDVLHLMSMISPIDSDLALVYSRLLPVPFRQWLVEREVKLVEVPDEEYLTMGCNVLAVAPRNCIMLSGNPQTKQRLKAEGVEVAEYQGEDVSRKGAGGPTCLTRPLLRVE